MGFDEAWWDDPSNVFAPKNLPSWNDFNNAFPRINGRDMSTQEIVNLIGGDVEKLADRLANDNDPNNDVNMVCALKLSRALNYAGITIPHIPTTGSYPGTVQGKNGEYYFMNAEAMNRWMRKVFGCANPNTAKGEYLNPAALHWTDAQLDENAPIVTAYFSNHTVKGIYSAVARKSQFRASGHCDLIDENAICVSKCYFGQAQHFRWLDIWNLQ